MRWVLPVDDVVVVCHILDHDLRVDSLSLRGLFSSWDVATGQLLALVNVLLKNLNLCGNFFSSFMAGCLVSDFRKEGGSRGEFQILALFASCGPRHVPQLVRGPLFEET
jgi:hypothetical protein